MNNITATGYALIVLKKYGLSKDELNEFIGDMRVVMDEYTEEEAEEAYRNT